ncbi:MAG: restriction endonuclease [Candidatus Electrothrix sp. GM3_4]|nr:restriction endonuclease [Candidatus Electrothrix sp. GM3_4]
MHGTGEAQVVISNAEIHALIFLALLNLGWNHKELLIPPVNVPSKDYYKIPLSWFEETEVGTSDPSDIQSYLQCCFEKDNDFSLFIDNLAALHRRRMKYRRILRLQPLPTMDQIGPRALLEFGVCDAELQAHWMVWRKWIYDIDNRAAQETGYLFEPLLASCLGGKPVGARNSPVKRLDAQGVPTDKGRQIDCFVPSTSTAYEFKLRVTIAASGQGRFGEELSFPEEVAAASLKPVLLVLDPTPSERLTELSAKFVTCGGQCLQGEDAWQHMESEAGEVVSVFINKFIKPAIHNIENVELSELQPISLNWSEDAVEIRSPSAVYRVRRKQ